MTEKSHIPLKSGVRRSARRKPASPPRNRSGTSTGPDAAGIEGPQMLPRGVSKQDSPRAVTGPPPPTVHAPKRTQGSGRTKAKCPVAFTPEQQQQLAALFEQHHASLALVARLRGLRDPDIVATDSLLKAFVGFDPNRGRFAPFLYKVLRGRIIDYWRGVTQTESRFVPLPAHFEAADHVAERAQQNFLIRDELEVALRCLPREDQLLLKLHYIHGFSLDEISRLS